MFTRSLALVLTVGALGAVGCVAGSAEDQASVSQNTGSGSSCSNSSRTVGSIQVNDVLCQASIANLTGINVTVKDVRVLNGNELSVLSGDFDNLSIADGSLNGNNILDGNKILDDVEVTALNDFLNKFNVNVTKNDIDVCALVGVLQLCK